MRILLLGLFIITSVIPAQAATPSDSIQFRRLIKKLKPLAGKLADRWWEDEDSAPLGAYQKYFDSVMANPLSLDYGFKDIGNVDIAKGSERTLRLVTWGFSTGGTSTYAGLTYVQCRYRDSVQFICLSGDRSEITCTYWTLYKLRTTGDTSFYLAMGYGKGNTSYGLYEALVIGLGPNGLIINHPAFPNRTPFMSLDMMCSYNDELWFFDPKKQVLTINAGQCHGNAESVLTSLNLIHPKDDNEEVLDRLPITKLKFNGKRFVLQRHRFDQD